jgi:glycosyltransferase involved in cell wall biosynthesis
VGARQPQSESAHEKVGSSVTKRDERDPASSVLICTRNRPQHLKRCLSFVAQLDFPNFEVVVVDNGSHDGAAERLAAEHGARYVVEEVVGLSRARNRGLEVCRGEFIAFIDDDAIPEADWLTQLVKAFETPEVMAVTGRVAHPDDTPVGPNHPLYPRFIVAESAAAGIDRKTPNWFELVNFGGVGIGANMAFRRRGLQELKGFDLRLGRSAPLLGNEETYAFFSLVRRGYQVVYNPHAIVRHPCGALRRELRTRYLKDLYGSAAYASFLFFEEPDYRQATLECALRRVRQRLGRMNGNGNGSKPPSRFPRSQLLLAAVTGPLLYFRSRLTNNS